METSSNEKQPNEDSTESEEAHAIRAQIWAVRHPSRDRAGASNSTSDDIRDVPE
jgi:hypothetical protein